jgi:hypothetical protein
VNLFSLLILFFYSRLFTFQKLPSICQHFFSSLAKAKGTVMVDLKNHFDTRGWFDGGVADERTAERLQRWIVSLEPQEATAESYGLIIGIEIKNPYLTLLVFLFCSWISNFLKYNPMFVLD